MKNLLSELRMLARPVEMRPGRAYHSRKPLGRAAPRVVALSLAALVAASAPAQQQEDPRFRIRTTVALVVVPVTVKSPAGEAVLDLRREEFRLFEDKVEQEIDLFSNDPFPLSAVVLLDNGLPQKA